MNLTLTIRRLKKRTAKERILGAAITESIVECIKLTPTTLSSLPTVAIFGAKDFQQAAIIKKMTADLNFPLKIIVAPTHRERDGLAMSSRNKYLTPSQRRQAVVLWLALQRAQAAVRKDPVPAKRLKADLARFIAHQPEAKVDYIEIFDPHTLAPARQAARGLHLALAVYIGSTRLIDNVAL